MRLFDWNISSTVDIMDPPRISLNRDFTSILMITDLIQLVGRGRNGQMCAHCEHKVLPINRPRHRSYRTEDNNKIIISSNKK